MSTRGNTKKTAKGLLYILLFLSCFNFLGRGPIFFFIFSIVGIIVYKIDRFNRVGFFYMMMSLSALVASLVFYDFNEWIKSLVFALSFLAGYSISSENDSNTINKIVFSAVLGFVAYLVFLGYINIIVLGHEAGNRTMINPWTYESIAVTLVGLNSCVPIVYSFYCLFCRKNFWFKIFGIFILVLSFWINQATATRTPFVLMAIVYLVMFLVVFKSGNGKKKIGLFFLLLTLFVAFFSVVLPRLTDTAIANRFSEEELSTSRTEIMKIYINHMWEYPFGGGFVQSTTHRMAHNVIQESYDIYGIVFFVFLVFVLIGFIKRLITLLKIPNKTSLSFLLISLYVGIIPQLMLEPVIQGYPQLLWFVFLIDGILVGVLKTRYIDDNILHYN